MAPVALCLMGVAALLLAEYRGGSLIWRAVAKLVAASAFVWGAVAWGALSSGYGQLLLAGLLLCWLGDALLVRPGQTLWFQLGIAAFLVAHLSYAVAFLSFPTDPTVLALSAVVFVVAAGWAIRWLRPHVPAGFRWPVRAYVVVITLMAVAAFGAWGGGGPPTIALGAFAFAISDLAVARDRFVSQSFVNSAWGLPLYFVAQLLLASTAASVRSLDG